MNFFDQVSLLECTESFIQKARESIPAERIHSIYPTTMQSFKADPQEYGCYDMIWIQWVIIYASDGKTCIWRGFNHFVVEGLVNFLKECTLLLKQGGLLCIKDNVILPKNASQDLDDVLLDQSDCSITRSERYLLELARLAGLEMVSREVQPKFPKEIFPVIMYAFKPQ